MLSKHRFPDFLIVGAARSGTTTLYDYLAQHPGIYMSQVKEPCFFAFAGQPTRFTHPETEIVWEVGRYCELLAPAAPEQLVGEASTMYLYRFRETIENIKRHVPHWRRLKVIAILRDPVERALSQYAAHRLWNVEPLPFEDALEQVEARVAGGWNPMVDYLGAGFYYQQISAFKASFPELKVFLYEDLSGHPFDVLRSIESFLGTREAFAYRPLAAQNPSGEPRLESLNRILQTPRFLERRAPWARQVIPKSIRRSAHRLLTALNRGPKRRSRVSEATTARLRALYGEDIARLEELIGRSLSHWKMQQDG